jgi:hypothetical protein
LVSDRTWASRACSTGSSARAGSKPYDARR